MSHQLSFLNNALDFALLEKHLTRALLLLFLHTLFWLGYFSSMCLYFSPGIL